ncbi:hypothetical protein N7537_004430, partial [Penicillium hordei]
MSLVVAGLGKKGRGVYSVGSIKWPRSPNAQVMTLSKDSHENRCLIWVHIEHSNWMMLRSLRRFICTGPFAPLVGATVRWLQEGWGEEEEKRNGG